MLHSADSCAGTHPSTKRTYRSCPDNSKYDSIIRQAICSRSRSVGTASYRFDLIVCLSRLNFDLSRSKFVGEDWRAHVNGLSHCAMTTLHIIDRERKGKKWYAWKFHSEYVGKFPMTRTTEKSSRRKDLSIGFYYILIQCFGERQVTVFLRVLFRHKR